MEYNGKAIVIVSQSEVDVFVTESVVGVVTVAMPQTVQVSSLPYINLIVVQFVLSIQMIVYLGQ